LNHAGNSNTKRRLARLERIDIRHPIYFITANTAGRKPILARRDLHDTFIRFALSGPEHGAWIGRYVLMPDHCHLFLAYDDERITLSNWAKSSKTHYPAPGGSSNYLRGIGKKDCSIIFFAATNRRPTNGTMSERILFEPD
jgi:hypothetical protein